MISNTGPSKPNTEKTRKADLYVEIGKLHARVAALETQVGVLQTNVLDDGEVIVLRTVNRQEATKEIVELFQAGETLFYSDIAKRLRLDLQTVVEICQELIEAEEIEIDADHSV